MKSLQTLLTTSILMLLISMNAFGDVEAVKGKKYSLTRKHGPWMVMVAAIRDVEEERRISDGLTASEAADELVYELRKQGIPAYTYSIDEKMEQIS